jgi:hypothetical protein
VTAADGFPPRAEIVRRYAARTGFDVSDVEWYQAFAFFKLAVVCQGIAARGRGRRDARLRLRRRQRLVVPLVAAGRRRLGHRLSASARQAPDRDGRFSSRIRAGGRAAHRTAIPPSTLRT